MAFTLTIAAGPDTGTSFPFDAKQARFGRTADNDVVVKDGSASRSHCRVFEEDHKYFLEDLKSANGTKINGALVSGTQQLFNGDTITIGDVAFTFTLPDATVMQPAYDGPPPPDVNATMIGVPSDLPVPPPSAPTGEPPPDANATMFGAPSGMPAPEEAPAEEPPLDPNATFLKSPAELEAIKASWRQKTGGSKPAPARPASNPVDNSTEPGMSPPPEPIMPEGGATMLKSPEELEAIKAVWKAKGIGVPGAEAAEEKPVDGNATMLKSPEELEKIRESWKQSGLAPDDTGPTTNPTLETGERTNPGMKELGDQTVPPKSARPRTNPGKKGDALARRDEEDEGLQPSGGAATKDVPGLPGKRPALARGKRGAAEPEEQSQLTAAEKARMKRELSGNLKGRLTLFWQSQPKNKRILLGAGGGTVAALFLGMLVWALVPTAQKPGKVLPPEPATLSPNANWIEESFGLGDGVDYERADSKLFGFNTQSPTRVVAILRFQARDISKDEVSITLNNGEVGFVAPDTMDVMNRELEVVLPSNLVKLREDNQLLFDNVKNPPGDDPWRIWNVWLEVLPMPELSPEETLTEARATVERAKKAYDLREVGPENLFKAWKQYRQAWLLLESLSDRPPELYDFVRQQLKAIVPEMDKRCANLLLEVKKEMESPSANYKRIRDMLEGISTFFPTREHRCNPVSKQILSELGG